MILTEVDYELYFLKKYLYEGKAKMENLKEFVQNYLDHKLERYYMSESVPE